MPRRHWLNPRSALAFSIAATIVLALLPARLTRFTDALTPPAETLVSPVQGVVRGAVNAVRGDGPGAEVGPVVRELEQRVDELQTGLLREMQINDDLRRQIADLQAGLALNPNVSFRSLSAPVIGAVAPPSVGLVKVQAGRNAGVTPGAVAVARGVHLVGRVIETAPHYCTVLTITHPSAGGIECTVMLDETTRGPFCLLEPTPDGALRGPVLLPEGRPELADEVREGMLVRLSDRHWPEDSSMLIVGQVESVSRVEAQRLRREIVVRPRLDLARVSEVVLRLPEGVQEPVP